MTNRSLAPRSRVDSDAHDLTKLFSVRVRKGLSGYLPPALLGLCLCLGLCLGQGVGGSLARAQAVGPQDSMAPASQGVPQGRPNSPLHPDDPQDPTIHRAEQRMVDRRNSERQKNLAVDTDKLLALAQQLKADVDKSTKDQLSIDVVKRAEQIEKLARSVKEKMRGY